MNNRLLYRTFVQVQIFLSGFLGHVVNEVAYNNQTQPSQKLRGCFETLDEIIF
jgi:hypothetical protein